MLNRYPPLDCALARESASARLDGELSELDGVRLDAHLRDCADCRAFAERLAVVTSELRRAPLERPGPAIAFPQRRRLGGLQVAAAAAAIVAAATVSSFALGRALGTQGGPTTTATSAHDLASLRADTLNQHLLAMIRRGQPAGVAKVGRIIFI
jgi:predicted anti-sigma-YlaC factor YlaD